VPDLPDRPPPSPTGTRRRLQALAARSWSPRALANETGIPARLISRELDGHDDLDPRLAGAVAEAYDRLWDRPAPAATAADRSAAAETFARAARSGWAPPMAWDDDVIDLPGGQPAQGWRRSQSTQMRAVDLVEDADFVRQFGPRETTLGEVAQRLGINRDRLDQAYTRARRYAARTAGRPGADAEREAEAG
jgi:hypothetical protein